MIRFYNKEKSDDKTKSLAQALSASKTSSGASITPYQVTQDSGRGGNNSDSPSTLEGAGSLLNNASKLYNGLKDSGFFNSGANNYGSGIFSSAINDNIYGGGNSYSAIGSAINNNVSGVGDSGSVLQGAISENVASGSGNSGGGIGGGAPWAAIANTGKAMYNNISGKSPKDYSDFEQTTIYPLQGAANGYAYGGPWGALGGALYGLGYSFKDDMGLKDSNFFTQMLYPIGMGDGGGLRIGGESILDIL